MSAPQPRPLQALIDTTDPFWPVMLEWIRTAKNDVAIVPRDRARAEASLVALQVTTRSPLGAIALETGGLLIDRGWVRVLGGGGPGLTGDVARWNGLVSDPVRPTTPGLLIVAYDAIGGFFAINGGALGGSSRNVFYFAPDTLEWEDLDRGYTDFIHFLCMADLEKFYEGRRWSGWESDVSALPFDKVFSIYPPLWTAEGKDVTVQSRAPVPALESFALQLDFARQLSGSKSGDLVRLTVTE